MAEVHEYSIRIVVPKAYFAIIGLGNPDNEYISFGGEVYYIGRLVLPDELGNVNKRFSNWVARQRMFLVMNSRGQVGIQREDVLSEQTTPV